MVRAKWLQAKVLPFPRARRCRTATRASAVAGEEGGEGACYEAEGAGRNKVMRNSSLGHRRLVPKLLALPIPPFLPWPSLPPPSATTFVARRGNYPVAGGAIGITRIDPSLKKKTGSAGDLDTLAGGEVAIYPGPTLAILSGEEGGAPQRRLPTLQQNALRRIFNRPEFSPEEVVCLGRRRLQRAEGIGPKGLETIIEWLRVQGYTLAPEPAGVSGKREEAAEKERKRVEKAMRVLRTHGYTVLPVTPAEDGGEGRQG